MFKAKIFIIRKHITGKYLILNSIILLCFSCILQKENLNLVKKTTVQKLYYVLHEIIRVKLICSLYLLIYIVIYCKAICI